MLFVGCLKKIYTESRFDRGFLVIIATTLLLNACQPVPPQTRFSVCKEVSQAVLDYKIPVNGLQVSEQTIRDERIVIHLEFKAAQQQHLTQVVCVFGAERYRTSENAPIYSLMPARMAINQQQLSEAALTRAIRQSGFSVD